MFSRSLAVVVALASVAHGSYNAVTSIGHEVCIPYTVQVTYTVTVDAAGAQIGSSKSEPVPKDKPAEGVNAYTSGKNGYGSGGYDGSYGADSAPAVSAVGQGSHGYGGPGYNGGSGPIASKAGQGSHGYGGGDWNGGDDAEPKSKQWGYGGTDATPITSIAKGYGAYSKAAAPSASIRKPYGSYEDEGDKDDYDYEDEDCDDDEEEEDGDDELEPSYSAKFYSGKGYSAGWSSSKSWSNAYGASSTSKQSGATASVSSTKSSSRSVSWTSSSKVSSSASSVSLSSISKSSGSVSSSKVSSSSSKSPTSSDTYSSTSSSNVVSSASSVSSSSFSSLESSSSSSAASSSSIIITSESASSTISSFTSSDAISSTISSAASSSSIIISSEPASSTISSFTSSDAISSTTSSAFSSTSSAAVCVVDNDNGCLTNANCCNAGRGSTCVQGQCLPCFDAPNNYITNGGFASGSLVPWEETPFPGIDSGVISDATAPDNDGFVYRADYGPDEFGRVSLRQVNVPIPSGTTVNCDFFYKIFNTGTTSGETDSNNAINLFIDNVLCSGSSPGTQLEYTQTGSFDYVVTGDFHVVSLEILQIVAPPAGSIYRLAVDALRIRPVLAPNGAAICPTN